MNPSYPKFLSDDQLNKLSTPNLLKLLDSARAAEGYILHYYGPRCCEICHGYIGGDWENDVLKYSRPITEYKNKIKSILQEPRHKVYDKRVKTRKKLDKRARMSKKIK